MTDLGDGGRAMISEATGRYHAAMGELRDVPWRVGRSNPRNLYADTGGDWKGHPPIGVMDSPELAREAAEAHNAALARRSALALIAGEADGEMAAMPWRPEGRHVLPVAPDGGKPPGLPLHAGIMWSDELAALVAVAHNDLLIGGMLRAAETREGR